MPHAPRAPNAGLWAAAITLLLLGAAACFNPSYKNGGLRCTNRLCPEGYECVLALDTCWKRGTSPPGTDAGSGGTGGNGPTPGPDAADTMGTNADARDAEGDAFDFDSEPEGDASDPIARLLTLEVTPGNLEPAFSPATNRYDLNLPLFTPNIVVTAMAEPAGATIALNDGSISGMRLMAPFKLSPGPARANLRVAAPGHRPGIYGVSINTGGVFTFLKGTSAQVNMAFGTVSAVAGNTLVVGAPNESGSELGPQTGDAVTPGSETGAVFVFRRENGIWRREVTLKPQHAHPMMEFGAAVAIAGDTVIVGAPGENSGTGVINGPADSRAAKAGAAFVFVRGPDGIWTQEAYLKASDAEAGDRFGASVAVSTTPGVMGATLTTAAVGAPAAGGPNNAARAGAIYVFVRPAVGSWSEQARPRPNSLPAGHEFGSSLSLSGDSLVTGAPYDDSGAGGVNPGATGAMATDSGAAFVFTRTGTVWSQPVYIKAPVAVAQAHFGARTVVNGNFLIIGAPGDSTGGGGVSPNPGGTGIAGSGAAFLYRRAGATWELVHQIKAMFPHPQDRFGDAIALSSTGTPTLVIGAPFDDTNEAGAYDSQMSSPTLDSGAIFIYRPGTDGRWSQVARLKAPNAERFDAFGASVAVDGDTVVAGANSEASSATNVGGTLADNGAPGSGAAYVF